MARVAALLAAVVCGAAVAACGDGAEPGAPEGATLVLDFQPNAVHAGLYAARTGGHLDDEGLDLAIREPSGTADGAKLLEAGRTEFAVLDINDFGLARERGLQIEAIAAIVQRPLAATIASDRAEIRAPADLRGKTVGVTGVPSDDAVLDTVLAEGGLASTEVARQTIGFESVRLLAAGKVDAAAAFWNAEGVELRRRGVPTREFRVDEFGAPRYPELVVAVPAGAPQDFRCQLIRGLERGYRQLRDSPTDALEHLLAEVEELDAASQRAQLRALMAAGAFSPGPRLDLRSVAGWERWATEHGILDGPVGGFAPPDC